MQGWTDQEAQRIFCAVNMDKTYQQLLKECRIAEEKYLNAVKMLPDDQRQRIENYIALCEEMDYRFSQLAYGVGRSEREEGMACHAICLLEE